MPLYGQLRIIILIKVLQNLDLFSIVYPLYPWDIATACSLSTTQFADVRPDSRYAHISLQSSEGAPSTPRPRALTLIISFQEDGSVSNFSVRCTTLQRPIRLTYEEVEQLLKMKTDNPPSEAQHFQCSSSQLVDLPFQPLLNPQHSVKAVTARRTSPSNGALIGFQLASSPVIDPPSVIQRVSSCCSEQDLLHTLHTLQHLAHIRRRYREQRGCIDFSFSEARFHVVDSSVEGTIQSNSCSMEVLLILLIHE